MADYQMDDFQKYEFDRAGFIRIPSLLTPAEVVTLAAAVDRLEEHLTRHFETMRPHRGWYTPHGRFDPEAGFYAYRSDNDGPAWIVEDFWNFDPAFHRLIGHAPSMPFVRTTIRGRVNLNNSNLLIRYPGNFTGGHMGGPNDGKYAYRFDHRGFDCVMTRMIYFLHDVTAADGAFCAVPGTHKSAFAPPRGARCEDEPGMVAVEVNAGDGIYFTEAVRHGGFTNRGPRARKSLHVGYGPYRMRAQQVATMDEPQFLLPRTWDALSEEQRELFQPHPPAHRPEALTGRAGPLTAG